MTRELSEKSLDPSPIVQLKRWMDDAGSTANTEPNAMSLATASPEGKPAVRYVLLRGIDEFGIRFYTSYFSRKGRQLEANPFVAAALFWPELHRQVLFEGVVNVLSEDESDAYFASRPRGHRLAAWASEQSEPIGSRELLEERFAHFDERFEGEDVPRPHSWGGYAIAPERFEFWQGQENRLHDRFEYRRQPGGWAIARLQP